MKHGRCCKNFRGRASYPECSHRFVDMVMPAIHRYAVQLHKLVLKQLERDGQSFIMKRWVSETHSILEEFDVLINRLKLIETKSGINLNLKHLCQISLVESPSHEILYDRGSSNKSFKRVRFDTVAVEVLPELVPDLPQAVVACAAEDLQDNSEIVVNPFYLQM